MKIPRMIKVKQTFNRQCLTDVEETTSGQINGLNLSFSDGARIAVAVGSRGVANLQKIVRATVATLKAKGAAPFIVPAMGSHGGATADGQKEVLAAYGITERDMGVPIKSAMDVVELSGGDTDMRVFMDKYAYQSDGVVVINRVKSHTDFHGPTESGLLKMCVVGLGKHAQAVELHRYGVFGLKELLPNTAQKVLDSGKIVFGIGIVENAYHDTMAIKAVLPEHMEREEKRLLALCKQNMPCLPVDEIDVLIIDEMGKDISGVGIDPNVTGRIRIRGEADAPTPRITNIVVTDLTEASHGNALGIGLADFITRRLYNKVDFIATYENVLTSTFTERAKIPIIAETEKEALEYALRTCGPVTDESVKIVRIKNTLCLDVMHITKSVYEEIKDRECITIMDENVEIFDEKGGLIAFGH